MPRRRNLRKVGHMDSEKEHNNIAGNFALFMLGFFVLLILL